MANVTMTAIHNACPIPAIDHNRDRGLACLAHDTAPSAASTAAVAAINASISTSWPRLILRYGIGEPAMLVEISVRVITWPKFILDENRCVLPNANRQQECATIPDGADEASRRARQGPNSPNTCARHAMATLNAHFGLPERDG